MNKCVAVAEIPEIQKLTIKITPIEGHILDLEMLGKKMIAVAEICKCFFKENMPEKGFYVGLGFAKTSEDNSFEFQTVTMPIAQKDAFDAALGVAPNATGNLSSEAFVRNMINEE